MVDILSNGLERLGIKDDLRKAMVVTRYEMMKFSSGKKIIILAGIALAALIAVTVTNVISGNNDTPEKFSSSIVNYVIFIAVLGATLFASVSIVSEFEERTALVLFTKPISKASIFVGKLFASLIVNVAVIIVYYILTAIATLIFTGGVPVELGASMFYACVYAFTLTCFAMLFSSFMKKASTATTITFILLLLGFPIIEAFIAVAMGGADANTSSAWFLPEMASSCIGNCMKTSVPYLDGFRDFMVMFLWGLVPGIAAYLIFKKRTL